MLPRPAGKAVGAPTLLRRHSAPGPPRGGPVFLRPAVARR